ncbi:MAG: penicillin-binding protein 2 [Candidatus Uhrbacteria bacterium]|nr:penicillin-binding protein 2 [Candidatus Uhrbacteria bacterium]
MKKSLPFSPEFSDVIDLKRSTAREWVESTVPFIHQHSSVQFLGTTIGRRKISLLLLGIFFVLGLFLVRSASLQIFSGDGFALLAQRNKVKTVTVSARRGVIYDRNGILLVQNVPNFQLQLNEAELPASQNERNNEFKDLEVISGVPAEDIVNQVLKHTSADPLVLMDNIEYAQALGIIVKTAHMPGVQVVLRDRRNYLFGSTMSLSHVLGHTGVISEKEYAKNPGRYLPSDSIGKDGIEAYYEDELHGYDGKKEMEVDALGAARRIVSENVPKDGTSIVLTIDKELQDVAEQSLKKILEKFHTKKGVVIASDPHTGEILAMVSLPTYDNNLFSKKITPEDYKKIYEDPSQPLYNRAIQGEYPAGSTIKPIVAAAALQEHVVTPDTSFLSTGGIRISQWFFPDWKAGGHGRINAAKAIAESVNTYFYIVSGGYNGFVGLGPTKLLSYFRLFRIDKKTGIDLPGEHAGFVPSPEWKKEKTGEPWYIGDTYHVAIGQGDILVTPLQINKMTEFFANGGWSVQSHIFRSVKADNQARDMSAPTPYIKDILDTSNVSAVREGMRQTVLAGSGRRLLSLRVPAAGKTGTAQWKSTARPHAWFTGWAPFDKPQIVVTVLVEEGEEGSRSAIAIADDVLRWYFANRDTAPQKEESDMVGGGDSTGRVDKR